MSKPLRIVKAIEVPSGPLQLILRESIDKFKANNESLNLHFCFNQVTKTLQLALILE